MKRKNGFTLVELLAVIVVLAIIMIIAIPNVLKAMNNARKNSFIIEAQKFVKDVKTQYTADSGLGGKISGPGLYVYEMSREDIGYDEQGSYNGFVVIDAVADKIDNPDYHVFMYDDNYQLINCIYNVTGILEKDVDPLGNVGENGKSTKTLTSWDVCDMVGGQGTACYAPNGYQIVNGDSNGENNNNNPPTNENQEPAGE